MSPTAANEAHPGLPENSRVPFFKRLSTRFALTLIVVGMVPGTLFTVYSLRTLTKVSREASRTVLVATTRDYEDRISTWVERGNERVRLASRLPTILEALKVPDPDDQSLKSLMGDLNSLRDASPVFIRSVGLFDRAGDLVAAAGAGEILSVDGSPDWFVEPLMTGRPAFTSQLIETAGGQLAFSAPILYEGRTLGVIRIGYDLSALDYQLAVLDTAARGESLVAILNRDGTLLASTFSATPEVPRGWQPGQPFPVRMTQNSLADLTDESIQSVDFGYGTVEAWKACFRSLESVPWVVCFLLPEHAYLAAAQRQITLARVITGLLMLLLIALAFASARVLSQDIRRLARAVSRFAEGDLSVRVPVRSEDEIGMLARSFNHMAVQLEHRTAALIEARQQSESASKAKSDFLSVLSHEVRTPLNAVIGYSDLILEEGGLSPDHQSSITAIRRAGHQLLRMLNDMLDFTKLEAGRVEVDPQSFELMGVIAEVLETATPEAVRKGLEITVEPVGQMPERMISDGPKLRQILINLVFNAVKFTTQGGVHIVLEFNRKPGGKSGNLMIMVEDTGIGICPEVRDRLFKPFSQGDASVTRKFGGTGLGLAISRHMATACGGDLSECSPGKGGACFVLTLPVEADGDEKLAQPALEAHHAGKHVLLLSRNPISESFLRDHLRKAGLRCLSVQDLPQTQPDLVLLDEPAKDRELLLPVLRQYRHLLREVPCLHLHPPTQTAMRVNSGGPAKVLTKPLLPAELVLQINSLLSGTAFASVQSGG